MKKLLAITPYFGKTGSEIALLNVLNAISTSFQIDVFTPNRQPELTSELAESISLYHPKSSKSSFSEKLKKRISKTSSETPSILDRWVIQTDYDYVLLNTLVSLSHFKVAQLKAKKTIIYIHETEVMLPTVHLGVFNEVIKEADLILCSSRYVKDYFKTLGRSKNIAILHPSLDYSKFNTSVKTSDLRTALGFRDADYVWAMVGAMTINKNPKLFIEIATKLHKTNPNAKFLWIGYNDVKTYDSFLKASITEQKLEDVVKFIEPQDGAYFDYINMMDGFVLTSFSESFSLASLEAACFGKPVVSFPCGGIKEAVPPELVKIAKEYSVQEIIELMLETMNETKPDLSNQIIGRLLETNALVVGDRFQEILKSNQL